MGLVSIKARTRRHGFAALVTMIAACGTPAAGPARKAAVPVQAQAPAAASAATATPPTGEIVDRKGPFALGDQSFTVVFHSVRLPGRTDPDGQTLASLEIRDASGTVHHQEMFPHEIENGDFRETCSADVEAVAGSNGHGLLISSGCLPSAPLSGGPWELFGVRGGRLTRIGKPLVTEGEFGAFVPGAVTRAGTVTQTLPDSLRVRMWTGYFFVTVPIRIDWNGGTLAPGQRCLAQTGGGFAEDGCEMPVEDAAPQRGQEQTFVRLFRESTERAGTPAHVVINPTSSVEILSAKVRVVWDETADTISLSPGEDIWVRLRIDGREGWIHTAEDLEAVGLFQAG